MDRVEESIARKYIALGELFDERGRRLWAAVGAGELGRGGIPRIARATGLSRNTISRGLDELAGIQRREALPRRRIRAEGGGRKSLTDKDPQLLEALERVVEPTTHADPQSPLRWTCRSTRQLAEALKQQGHPVGRQKVCKLLEALGYSLQAKRKSREGSNHEDRDAQFAHINAQVGEHQHRGQPVISVDTNKKELVGDFRNGGREWRPRGEPEEVRTHDCMDRDLGKVNPDGIDDQSANVDWASVGTDHDTAEFAVESIRRWWLKMGSTHYPHARVPRRG
jgi:DNA-binding phage protein